MHSTRLGVVPLAVLLTAALITPASPASPAPAPVPDRPDSAFQTSEQVRGPAAAARVRSRSVAPRITGRTGYAVASGVAYSTWSQRDDPARDPYRVHLLDVDVTDPGTRVDLLAGPGPVPIRRNVRAMVLDEPRGVAGINGDFFDIRDTGAPLGNSRDRQRRIRSARQSTWLRSFTLDSEGRARIGKLRLNATIKQRPNWLVSHLNSPTVWPDRIGIYTSAWGETVGDAVTDGRTARVREVWVRGGRVVRNQARLSRGETIRGRVLIGRGDSADLLRQLTVGSRVSFGTRLGQGGLRVAISGSDILLKGGTVRVTNDVELHPRTAVGIDRDTGHLLLVTVDGRSESSSGTTMVGLADLMAQVGAEAALNLDGGGSSTMVGRNAEGALKVLNTPSDGRQRPVPNGLAVLVDP